MQIDLNGTFLQIDRKERSAMTTSLRDQLIGAWTLVSYVEKPVDRSAPFHPFGETPNGIIMYTPGGFMSAGKLVNSYLQWRRALQV